MEALEASIRLCALRFLAILEIAGPGFTLADY